MGLVLLAIVLLIFGYKNIFGYTKVEKVCTLSGCSVKTNRDVYTTRRRHRRHGARVRHKHYIYYVSVTYEAKKSEISSELSSIGVDPNKPDSVDGDKMQYVIFDRTVQKKFYDRFSSFGTDTITFFKTKDGTIFPVYKYDSTDREAEKVYRDVNPPNFWYWVYNIGLGLAGICFILGLSGIRTSKNYSNNNGVTSPSVNFDNFDQRFK